MGLIALLLLLAVLFGLFFVFALVGTAWALLPWIVVGGIAGWLASAITRSRHGCLGDIVIGIAGSIIGGVLYVALTGHRVGGFFGLTHIAVATVGAVILLVIIKALRGRA